MHEVRLTKSPVLMKSSINFIKLTLLTIALALTFHVFRYFPGMDVGLNIWIVINLLYLIGPYSLSKFQNGLYFSNFEKYILFLVILMPVIVSFVAYNVFLQPIYYGVASQRTAALCVTGLAILQAYRRGFIKENHIEKVFIILAWATLILYSSMYLFMRPENFLDAGSMIKAGVDGGIRFNFDPVFIDFAVFYYIFSAYVSKRNSKYLLALPFFLYVVVIDMGRARLLAILITILMVLFKFGSTKRALKNIVKAVLFIFLCGALIYTANPEFISSRMDKIIDAFNVVVFGADVIDNSANARNFEVAIIMPYVTEHWLWGCGRISEQWGGGFSGVIGDYFYAGDVGLLGVIFVYGIFGLFVYSLQFFFAWGFVKKNNRLTLFAISVAAYMLFHALYSLASGLFAYDIEVGIFMTAILCGAVIENKKAMATKYPRLV